MEVETFPVDRRRAFGDARRHRQLETCLSRRPCHGQAEREEVPVLGNEIEQARAGHVSELPVGGARAIGECGGSGNRGSCGQAYSTKMSLAKSA